MVICYPLEAYLNASPDDGVLICSGAPVVGEDLREIQERQV